MKGEYETRKAIQSGDIRLERQSAAGMATDVKKGGAGGKFTWGKVGETLSDEEIREIKAEAQKEREEAMHALEEEDELEE